MVALHLLYSFPSCPQIFPAFYYQRAVLHRLFVSLILLCLGNGDGWRLERVFGFPAALTPGCFL